MTLHLKHQQAVSIQPLILHGKPLMVKMLPVKIPDGFQNLFLPGSVVNLPHQKM
jgi:hypothetical protein